MHYEPEHREVAPFLAPLLDVVPHTVAVLVISVASDSGRVDNLTCPGPTEVLVHILVPLQ